MDLLLLELYEEGLQAFSDFCLIRIYGKFRWWKWGNVLPYGFGFSSLRLRYEYLRFLYYGSLNFCDCSCDFICSCYAKTFYAAIAISVSRFDFYLAIMVDSLFILFLIPVLVPVLVLVPALVLVFYF